MAATGHERRFRDVDGWNRTLDDMVNYGMNVTPQERAQILEYLVTSLGR